MFINGSIRTASTSARSGATRSASTGAVFDPFSGAETQRATATAAAAPMSGIDALLALQAVEDPLLKKKKAMRRGNAMLDTLDQVKADLLVGRVSDSRLNQLMVLITQAREKSLPGLDAVLDDIELRVRVELAKLGRFSGT